VGGGRVTLFGRAREKLPRWFLKYKWGPKIDFIRVALFGRDTDLGLRRFSVKTFEIALSSPERAMLEVLHLVPKDETFDEAQKLMENLTTLRPSLVQTLLERCTSIKAKRLFMFMAGVVNHGWVKRLKLSRVNFGKGKRLIIEGGRLDPKYKITVPRTNE